MPGKRTTKSIEAARANGKKGGRPRGSKDPETLEREKVNEHLRQRTMRIADKLFESQVTVAQGQMFLFRIDKTWIKPPSGKGGFYKNKKPVIVTDPDEIAEYLNGDFDNRTDNEDGGASYYFITTKEPNNSAIESMLDRALGGAPKSLEVSNPDGSLKQVIIIKHGQKR